jgi:putative membrane protein
MTSQRAPQGTSVQEYLATDRTVLANERTLLAYIRTALTLMIVGLTLIKFFESLFLDVAGWTFIPLGIITGVVGLIRYERTRRLIHEVERRNHFTIPDS